MAYLAFRSRASAAVPGTYATATQCLCGHLLITQSFSRFSDLLQGPGVCTGTDYDWLERFFWEKLKYCSMRTFFCFCFSALTWLVSVNGDRYFFVMQSLVLERWRFARSEDVCVHPVSDRQEHCFFFFFFCDCGICFCWMACFYLAQWNWMPAKPANFHWMTEANHLARIFAYIVMMPQYCISIEPPTSPFLVHDLHSSWHRRENISFIYTKSTSIAACEISKFSYLAIYRSFWQVYSALFMHNNGINM